MDRELFLNLTSGTISDRARLNIIMLLAGFLDQNILMNMLFSAAILTDLTGAQAAVDNASGAATVAMEAARLIMAAGGKPERTIMVQLWAAEEFGLLGSVRLGEPKS